MKQFKIESQSTSGKWFFKSFKNFENQEQANEHVRILTSKTKYPHRAKFHANLEEEPVESPEEVEQVEETEDTEQVEVPSDEGSDTSTQLDHVDWADSHDEDNFPLGWWLKKRFVAKDGTVFERKEERPDLYRQLEPSEY